MDEKIVQPTREGRDRLSGWLNAYRKAGEAAPLIQKALEIKEWELEMVSTLPSEVAALSGHELQDIGRRDLQQLSSFPAMPDYNISDMDVNLAFIVSSGSAFYGCATAYGNTPDPALQSWSQTSTFQYEAIQSRQTRSDSVRNLLASLGPSLVRDFDSAESSYSAAVGRWGTRESAANAMRNVLDHYRGVLFEKAIHRPAEQKVRWADMAARLSVEPQNPAVCQELVAQEAIWDRLHQQLSDIVHEQKAGVNVSLTTVHTELLDHLYSVLTLARIL